MTNSKQYTTPFFTSTINWKLKDRHKEHPSGLSETVPDDSYTIADLVKKFASGVDPAISKIANYGGDDDEVDFDDIDMQKAAQADYTDVDEIKAAAAARQLNLLQEMEQIKQKKATPKKPTETEDDLRNDNEDDTPEAEQEEPTKTKNTQKGKNQKNQ